MRFFIEHVLLKKNEKIIIQSFDHIVLVSKGEFKFFSIKKKIKIISNGTDLKKKL